MRILGASAETNTSDEFNSEVDFHDPSLEIFELRPITRQWAYNML